MVCSFIKVPFILILLSVKAHSAYTWDELAEAICRSYVGINQVLVFNVEKKYQLK